MMGLKIMKYGGKEMVEHDGDQSFIPPINFANVEDRVYRSGFPQPGNFAFLETLQLRSVIYLCTEPYPRENLEFLKSRNIRLFQFGIDGTKEPSVDILRSTITEALKVLIGNGSRMENFTTVSFKSSIYYSISYGYSPHRTGCLVGTLRKVQNWCLSSVLEEYKIHAGVKSRDTDLKFLETYDVSYLRQCLHSVIYQYHGYGSKKRRLLSGEKTFCTNPE
ncbi:Protein-tyrosine phosphatase, dual specificity phosphatase, eukaryotic [Cynara cardunculus var. scolymus]|uniref:Protein-tyrosine phosphatase, dual specificity phosphatase, eukaryotic n=1 Tax=Cynara cardunculus var. scolymus TaxID=59895 RepID=A0A103YEC9_CYNCS|nr:Protein-tyrosine phosphatase, dual specificity phosphatase, eukaryotic [Cynara cardunculus var. scolymus]